MVDAENPGVEHRGPGPIGVDHGAKRQSGDGLGGVGTHHPDMEQGHRSGFAQPNRASDPTGVPRGDAPAALGGPGEGAFLVGVPDGRAGGLHGQQVVGAGPGQFGHFEEVGGERALGGTEVRTVQPHVALEGDPGELQERSPI